jgi:hypothetical protein
MERIEHMFNMLNKRIFRRKYWPFLCKFLANVSGFFHAGQAVPGWRRYLLERMDFRNQAIAPIGRSIAFPLLQPVVAHFCTGKG